MPAPLIETKNLCKVYPETKALDNLSLSLNSGEILGLLGPNGAGKTTAIHILLGLLAPSSGEVMVFGLTGALSAGEKTRRVIFQLDVQTGENLRKIRPIGNGLNERLTYGAESDVKSAARIYPKGVSPETPWDLVAFSSCRTSLALSSLLSPRLRSPKASGP